MRELKLDCVSVVCSSREKQQLYSTLLLFQQIELIHGNDHRPWEITDDNSSKEKIINSPLKTHIPSFGGLIFLGKKVYAICELILYVPSLLVCWVLDV